MEQKIKELPAFKVNGFIMLAVITAIMLISGWCFVISLGGLKALLATGLKAADLIFNNVVAEIFVALIPPLLAATFWWLSGFSGFFSLEPNQAIVLVLFGKYMGTVREAGFWWTIPFVSKQKISLRVRNFSSNIIKVNDAEGSPIEIAAVVVWQVFDSAKSKFAVDDYEAFVAIQSETAIRALAIQYPYDSPDDVITPLLRGIPDEVAQALQKQLQARLEVTGVEVIEARLSHLAYAPEIAQMMLRRQQAKALIDARRQLVEGAVGMVNEALNRLSQEQLVELDDERKASMMNNLLVVLTSEQTTQPVINTGTLYN